MRIVNICAFLAAFSVVIYAATVDDGVAARAVMLECPTPPPPAIIGIGPACTPAPSA